MPTQPEQATQNPHAEVYRQNPTMPWRHCRCGYTTTRRASTVAPVSDCVEICEISVAETYARNKRLSL